MLESRGLLCLGLKVPPAYPLADMHGRARVGQASGDSGVAWNMPKTLRCVSDSLGVTLKEAKRFVYDGLLELQDGHYFRTYTELSPHADAYGIELSRLGWYVKFSMVPATLRVISFHRPSEPLQTLRMGLIR